jgi:CRP/FNR family transcriptional regulator
MKGMAKTIADMQKRDRRRRGMGRAGWIESHCVGFVLWTSVPVPAIDFNDRGCVGTAIFINCRSLVEGDRVMEMPVASTARRKSEGDALHHPDMIERASRGAAAFHRAAAGAERRLEANVELSRMPETERLAGILLSGWACRYCLLPDGRRQILDVLLPGDLIGLDRLFAEKPHDLVLTLTDVTLGSIDHDAFVGLCLDPEIALYLLSRMTAEKRRLDRKLTMIGQMVADERIAALLIESFQRLRQHQAIKGESFHFPLTQQQIGDFLGMTVVHVNRVLKRLRNDGIVIVRHRVAIIRDMAALSSLASGGADRSADGPRAMTAATALPDSSRDLYDDAASPL